MVLIPYETKKRFFQSRNTKADTQTHTHSMVMKKKRNKKERIKNGDPTFHSSLKKQNKTKAKRKKKMDKE